MAIYKRNLTTTHGDKTTVTTHDPKTTTRIEQDVNGFYNPDGTPNESARAAFEEQKRQIAPAYHVNPDTGEVDKRTFLSDMFPGLDDVRKQREAEEALNRRKAKESAWYNGLSVLGDMLTTAIGGNVWQRTPDRHGKEAHDANIALAREQAAEDNAASQAVEKTKQAYASAVQRLYDQVGKAYGTKVSKTTEEGGKTTQTTTQGADKTTGYVGGSTGSSSGSGRGSGSGGKDYLPILLKNGSHGQEYMTVAIDKNEKKALSMAIAKSVEDAAAAGDKNAERLWLLYFTPGNPGSRGGRGQKATTTTPDKWNYDGLINDATLYQIPGALNRYLDELVRLGLTHKEGDRDVPYRREELYVLMTGDKDFSQVPAGVRLNTNVRRGGRLNKNDRSAVR